MLCAVAVCGEPRRAMDRHATGAVSLREREVYNLDSAGWPGQRSDWRDGGGPRGKPVDRDAGRTEPFSRWTLCELHDEGRTVEQRGDGALCGPRRNCVDRDE